MNFALKELELHIDDVWIEQAEALIEAHPGQRLQEIERHLWVGVMGDHEIEIQITPSKVKAYTCDCSDYKSFGICAHVTAGLLFLRKEMERRKEEKQEKAAAQPLKAAKLTIPLILRNASETELRNFVRQYARINKDFALALKARFASQVSTIDSHSKYEQIMDALVKPGTAKKRKMPAKTRQQLYRLLEELDSQATANLETNNPQEAFAISRAALDKAGAILRWPSDGEDAFSEQFEAFLKLLLQILRAQAAPALKEKIFAYLIDLCFTPTFLEKELSSELIGYGCSDHSSMAERQQILDQLDIALTGMQLSKRIQLHLLVNKMQLLELLGRSEEQEALIEEYITEPNVLLHAIDKALRQEQYSQVQALVARGLADYNNFEIQRALHEALLVVASREKDKKEIARIAEWLFLHSYQLEYFRQYKETFRKTSWPKAWKKLLQQVEAQPFSMEKRDGLSDLYKEEEQPQALYDYISRIRSLDLLIRHGRYLLNWDREKVEDLHLELLQHYINSHIGRLSSQRARRLIQHLHEIAAPKLAARLVSYLRKEHGERDSLMDELAVFVG